MSFELMDFTSSILQKQAVNKILACNDFTAKYQLTLTIEQARELAETLSTTLRDNGRIDFSGGVVDKIIKNFCDSPYLNQQNYSETLNELTELFYYFKNQTLDRISDDDLIKWMNASFDNVCHGSLEMLAGTELERLASNLRYGYDPNYTEPQETEEENE